MFKHAVTGDRPVRLELDMYFDQLSDGEQTLRSITLSRKSGQVALARACGVPDAGVPSCSFFLAACLFNVDAGTNPCTSYWFPAIARPFAVGAWSHVALEATFAKEGHILFEAGGQPIVDVVTATHPGDPPSDAPTIVTVGVGVIQGTAQVHLLVDNVAITLR